MMTTRKRKKMEHMAMDKGREREEHAQAIKYYKRIKNTLLFKIVLCCFQFSFLLW